MKTIQYIEQIDNLYFPEEKQEGIGSISAILNFKEVDTEEPYAVYRIIKLDYKNEKATVQDFEYIDDELGIEETMGQLDYDRIEYIQIEEFDEERMINFINIIDNFVIGECEFVKYHKFE